MQENREMNIPREQTVLEYLEGTDGYVSNNELIRVIVTNTGYGNQPLSEFMNKHKLQYNREVIVDFLLKSRQNPEKQTIGQYLAEYINSNVSFKHIIQNFLLTNIPFTEFVKHFNLQYDKEKIVGFILNPNNAFVISKFGYNYDSMIVDEQAWIDPNVGIQYKKTKRGL